MIKSPFLLAAMAAIGFGRGNVRTHRIVNNYDARRAINILETRYTGSAMTGAFFHTRGPKARKRFNGKKLRYEY